MKLSSWFVGCVVALSASGAVQVQAQMRSPFDGVYQGVSRQLAGGAMSTGRTRSCEPDAVPAPLTISGGVAHAGSQQYPLEGTVSPQGALVMRSPGGHFEGQIDAQGRVVGVLVLNCSYQMTWQRR